MWYESFHSQHQPCKLRRIWAISEWMKRKMPVVYENVCEIPGNQPYAHLTHIQSKIVALSLFKTFVKYAHFAGKQANTRILTRENSVSSNMSKLSPLLETSLNKMVLLCLLLVSLFLLLSSSLSLHRHSCCCFCRFCWLLLSMSSLWLFWLLLVFFYRYYRVCTI